MNKCYRDFIMEKITVSEKMLEIYPEFFSHDEPETLYADLEFEDYYNKLKGIFDVLFGIDVSFDTIDTVMEQLHVVYVKNNIDSFKRVDTFEEFIEMAVRIRVSVCKTLGYSISQELQERFRNKWKYLDAFIAEYDRYKLETTAIDAITNHLNKLSEDYNTDEEEDFPDETY